MAYCVKADIVKVYTADFVLETTDEDQDGIGDDALVTQAITDADAEIDLYLGKAYGVPLTGTIPDAIKLISVWLAGEWLMSRTLRVHQAVAVNAARARSWLTKLANGDMILSDVGVSEFLLPWSTTENEQPVFVRDRNDVDGDNMRPDLTGTMNVW